MGRFSHACAGLRGKAIETSINEDLVESVRRDYKRDNLNREPSSLPSPASED